MKFFSLIVIVIVLNRCDSLKILHFAPGVSKSHVIFNDRLAKMLSAQGHEVTVVNHVFSPQMNAMENVFQAPIREIRLFVNFSEELWNSSFGWFQNHIFKENASPRKVLKFAKGLQKFWPEAFRWTLEKLEAGQLPELTQDRFDLAIAHFFDLTPVAVAHRLQIPKMFWVASGTFILEMAAISFGLPMSPSFIPSALYSSSDRMDFWARANNIVSSVFDYGSLFLPSSNLYTDEAELFQESQPNRSLLDLTTEIAMLLVNGELFLDFPRPLPYNALYLGSVELSSASNHDKQALHEPFQAWVAEGKKGVIVFTFGTVADPLRMPKQMKATFVQGLANFTDYSIIWRMEGEIPGIENHPHIHVSSWLPQKQLLQHPKTRLFITHGGYNSLLESTKAGVPMVMIPLFADQNSNAARADRHALGRVLPDKLAITPRSFQDAVNAVLTQPQYERNAKRLSVLLGDKLISPEEEFARRLETVVRAPWYPKLGAAQRLSFWQYHSLDILALVLLFVFVAVYLLVKVLLILLRIAEAAQKKKRRS